MTGLREMFSNGLINTPVQRNSEALCTIHEVPLAPLVDRVGTNTIGSVRSRASLVAVTDGATDQMEAVVVLLSSEK